MKHSYDTDDGWTPQNNLSKEPNANDFSSRIKLGLQDSLHSLNMALRFASSGDIPIEVNPCISISGLGTIGLPLSERDARLIMSVSHQAPYEKSREPIVDAAVKQIWEMNADQFELRNPKWNMALEKVIERVAVDLDTPGGIKATPYKMFLYEKGSMFKEHQEYVSLELL
jgi:hypothetical protein